MSRPGYAYPCGWLYRLGVVQHRAFWDSEVVCRVVLSVRVEAKDRQPLGSVIWCGGSRLGVRHQRAGTSAGRSGFQKCPFVMPLPGSASSPFL